MQITLNGEMLRAHVTEWSYSTVWPGGSGVAEWSTLRRVADRWRGRRGTDVQIWTNGCRIWRGTLTGAPVDGKWSAIGLHAQADEVPALDSSSVATAVPNTAVTAARARGALPGWTGPVNVSSTAVADSTELLSVKGLLDAWGDSTGRRWGIDPDGVLVTDAGDPAPAWMLPPGIVRLAPVDSAYASRLIGLYRTATSGLQRVTVADWTAEQVWGVRERDIDLRDIGVLTQAKATALLAGLIAKGATRLQWDAPIETEAGVLRNLGGVPSTIPPIAGDVVRIHGHVDTTRPTAMQTTDVRLGEVMVTERAWTLTAMNSDSGDSLEAGLRDLFRAQLTAAKGKR